ncbi:MAG: 4Fe-4S binding protein [Deltaproteobacteria bacterium]|nr:4Fe-4S binding protein [Deltaproteobacteria bacterium]
MRSSVRGGRTLSTSNAIIGWKNLSLGCAILEPGSSRKLKTGDWRSQHPVLDKEKCIKCAICYIDCPDLAYTQNEEGYFIADMTYCKGCGICANECPKDAITMKMEEE